MGRTILHIVHFGQDFHGIKIGKLPIPYDLSILLVASITSLWEKLVVWLTQKETHRMFMATLLANAKNGKQFKRPSIGKWINFKWDFYTIDYHRAMKMNEIKVYEGCL